MNHATRTAPTGVWGRVPWIPAAIAGVASLVLHPPLGAGRNFHDDRGPMASARASTSTSKARPNGTRTRAARPGRPSRPPVVGVSCDMDAGRIFVSRAYIAALSAAGGTPVLLCPVPGPGDPVIETARRHAEMCDAFVFSGGDDPATEEYGIPTHPRAKRVHPDRQRYEEALLACLADEHPDKPVLGVCLGMQMMALAAGGTLNQHLPDDTATAADHAEDSVHEVRIVADDTVIPAGKVTSRHHQAVRDAGELRVVARAHDGVVEAIDDPERKFYVGVQWHPERTPSEPMGAALFGSLVTACGRKRVRK